MRRSTGADCIAAMIDSTSSAHGEPGQEPRPTKMLENATFTSRPLRWSFPIDGARFCPSSITPFITCVSLARSRIAALVLSVPLTPSPVRLQSRVWLLEKPMRLNPCAIA